LPVITEAAEAMTGRGSNSWIAEYWSLLSVGLDRNPCVKLLCSESNALLTKESDTMLLFYCDAMPSERNGSEKNRQLDLSNVSLKAGVAFSF